MSVVCDKLYIFIKKKKLKGSWKHLKILHMILHILNYMSFKCATLKSWTWQKGWATKGLAIKEQRRCGKDQERKRSEGEVQVWRSKESNLPPQRTQCPLHACGPREDCSFNYTSHWPGWKRQRDRGEKRWRRETETNKVKEKLRHRQHVREASDKSIKPAT